MTDQTIFDRGISKVRNVVSDTSIEQREFIKSFVRMCNDGWLQGWHEANGGNASYRMKPEEVSSCRSYFNETPGEWVSLGVQADSLRNEFFVVTGAGSHFRSLALVPSRHIGIVEINAAGDSWRVAWGLKDSGKPSSEFVSHFMNHAVRKVATGDACRVIYHAHPSSINALTLAVSLNDRDLSRMLWKSMSECVLVFPEGIGLVPWKVPGSPELAIETSGKMENLRVVVWEQHGVFCAGNDFDDAFGLMHTVEKAAEICTQARLITGSFEFENALSDDNLQAWAKSSGLSLNEDFLR